MPRISSVPRPTPTASAPVASRPPDRIAGLSRHAEVRGRHAGVVHAGDRRAEQERAGPSHEPGAPALVAAEPIGQP